MLGNDSPLETLMNAVDYSRYQTLHITRRGPPVNGVPSVLDIQMRADGPGGNGKLPTAGHEGHWELSEIWRDVGRDDSVRCAVLRGSGLGFDLRKAAPYEAYGELPALMTEYQEPMDEAELPPNDSPPSAGLLPLLPPLTNSASSISSTGRDSK